MGLSPEHGHRARGGLEVAGQHLHRRGFARPVGAEEANDLAFADVERDALHGFGGAIGLGQGVDVDHRSHHGPRYAKRTTGTKAEVDDVAIVDRRRVSDHRAAIVKGCSARSRPWKAFAGLTTSMLVRCRHA